MTLGELMAWKEFLENVIQLGWLETPTNSSPLQLVELEMNCITDQVSYASPLVWKTTSPQWCHL